MIATHLYTATLYANGNSYPLELTDGTVTMDEGWSPHVQAQLTIRTPSAGIQTLLDPRKRVRVTVTAAATYSPVNVSPPPASSVVFDLCLTSRSIAHTPGSTTLTLASDEVLLQEDVQLLPTIQLTGPYRYQLRSIVAWVLARHGAGLQPGLANFNLYTADLDALRWQPGVTAWAFLDALLVAAGMRLFCDHLRRWYVVDENYVLDALLAVDADLQLTEARDTITRSESSWFDAAAFFYAWTDDDGIARTASDIYAPAGYTKTRVFEVARPYPGPGAAAYAVKRAAGKGRQMDFSMLSDYSTRPTRLVFATFPDRPRQVGLVSSVTWSITTDEMNVTTRDLIDTPSTAWVLSPVGITWNDQPAGLAWTEYTNN